ncbi:hypothetical protein EPO17_03405, partial [Patescibacteria group bacterium]
MHFGLVIVLWGTSGLAGTLNVVTGGSRMVSDIFAFYNLAGMIGTVGIFLWRKKHGPISVRSNLVTVKIIMAGLIGQNFGLGVIMLYCFFTSPLGNLPVFPLIVTFLMAAVSILGRCLAV